MAKKEGRGTFFAAFIAAMASLLTAAIAVTAVTFAEPADLRAETRSLLWHYSVAIESPRDGAEVKRPAGSKTKPPAATINGGVKMPRDWVLLVFIQSPDELRYYVAGGVAVPVAPDGRWTINETFGSGAPDEDGQSFKIYAVLATRDGQREFLDGLQDRNTDAPWLKSLPHHAREDIVRVRLRL